MTLPAGDRHCDVILPRIQKRHVLEESNDLEPRVSLLEADDLDDEEEEDDEEDEDEEGMEEGEHRGSSRGDTLDCKSVLSLNRSFQSKTCILTHLGLSYFNTTCVLQRGAQPIFN